jgi:hypothetical protein
MTSPPRANRIRQNSHQPDIAAAINHVPRREFSLTFRRKARARIGRVWAAKTQRRLNRRTDQSHQPWFREAHTIFMLCRLCSRLSPDCPPPHHDQSRSGSSRHAISITFVPTILVSGSALPRAIERTVHRHTAGNGISPAQPAASFAHLKMVRWRKVAWSEFAIHRDPRRELNRHRLARNGVLFDSEGAGVWARCGRTLSLHSTNR